VFVVPLTTTRRGLSLHVEIEPSATTGLAEVSYAQCEWVRSVNRRRLVRSLGTVDPLTSREITQILRTLFGF
jgi:mRNA-degrading endonuclease toxin of MazEF toxin-antitoxin module